MRPNVTLKDGLGIVTAASRKRGQGLNTVAFLAEAPGSATIEDQQAALHPDDHVVLAGKRSFKELGEALERAGIPLRPGDRIKIHDFNCLPLSTDNLLRALSKFLGDGISIEIVKPGIVLEAGGTLGHALVDWLDAHYRYVHGLKTHPVDTAPQGRKRLLTAERYSEICAMLTEPNATRASVAEKLGVSRGTLFNYLERFGNDSGSVDRPHEAEEGGSKGAGNERHIPKGDAG